MITRNWGTFPQPPWTEWLDDGREMRLLRDFRYEDPDGVVWTAGGGEAVDGATIPRVFWSIVGGPFEGRYRYASVVHDTECRSKAHRWRSVHRMFHRGCRAGGVSPGQALLLYAAVYLFGPRWPTSSAAVARERMPTHDDAVRLTAWVRAHLDADLAEVERLTLSRLRREVTEAQREREDARIRVHVSRRRAGARRQVRRDPVLD